MPDDNVKTKWKWKCVLAVIKLLVETKKWSSEYWTYIHQVDANTTPVNDDHAALCPTDDDK